MRAEELKRMESGLRSLGLLGNTAPLLGLLGTILGMIKAFMVIEEAGGRVDAQALAGGIWEAMITTGVGLGVASAVTTMTSVGSSRASGASEPESAIAAGMGSARTRASGIRRRRMVRAGVRGMTHRAVPTAGRGEA